MKLMYFIIYMHFWSKRDIRSTDQEFVVKTSLKPRIQKLIQIYH